MPESGRTMAVIDDGRGRRLPGGQCIRSTTRHRPGGVRGMRLLALAPALMVCVLFDPTRAAAQGTAVVELYGVVQLAPGPGVITLDLLDQVIRFAVRDIRSVDPQLTTVRLLSDVGNREPSLYLKGQAHILEILLREKPDTRMLRIMGVYYPTARTLNVTNVGPFRAPQGRQF